jgi:Ca-activated chloride channel family protein
MTFIWPWLLLTLLLVPILVGVYIGLYRRRQRPENLNNPLTQITNNYGRPLRRRVHVLTFIYLFGLTLLLFSLSRPEVFVEFPQIQGTVILAFDVSNSMAAEDFEPNRMEAAKAAARIFVEKQPGTIQIGVVAFSNGSLVVQQPTDDQSAVLSTIDRLKPQGATSLGQGIFSALNAIVGEPLEIDQEALEAGTFSLDIGNYPSAVILLLTDGENTSSLDPLEISQLAADAGVRVYPVGIGSEVGTILHVDGYNVLTQLNKATLQAIADITNGAYYQAEDEESLQEIYEKVDLHLTIGGEKMELTAILAGISLLTFLFGGTLSLFWFGRMP